MGGKKNNENFKNKNFTNKNLKNKLGNLQKEKENENSNINLKNKNKNKIPKGTLTNYFDSSDNDFDTNFDYGENIF